MVFQRVSSVSLRFCCGLSWRMSGLVSGLAVCCSREGAACADTARGPAPDVSCGLRGLPFREIASFCCGLGPHRIGQCACPGALPHGHLTRCGPTCRKIRQVQKGGRRAGCGINLSENPTGSKRWPLAGFFPGLTVCLLALVALSSLAAWPAGPAMGRLCACSGASPGRAPCAMLSGLPLPGAGH